MVEVEVRIDGLKEAFDAVRAAFPDDPKKQRSILNRSLSGAARKAVVPMAKQLALQGDESGALSDSITVRARSYSNARKRGAVASVVVTPLRMDAAAMATYVNYYYTSKGIAPPAGLISGGIRHGHLIEFGTVRHAARPFLYPALKSGFRMFLSEFTRSMKKKTEATIERAAKKQGLR